MQRGCALVHGEHIGASTHVGARVTWLHVANGQDAVEVHSSGRQLPIVQTGPYQGVGWGLQAGSRVREMCGLREPRRLPPLLPCWLTLLLAVQMKVTSAPGRTLWLRCSSTVTVMGLLGASVSEKSPVSSTSWVWHFLLGLLFRPLL